MPMATGAVNAGKAVRAAPVAHSELVTGSVRMGAAMEAVAMVVVRTAAMAKMVGRWEADGAGAVGEGAARAAAAAVVAWAKVASKAAQAVRRAAVGGRGEARWADAAEVASMARRCRPR